MIQSVAKRREMAEKTIRITNGLYGHGDIVAIVWSPKDPHKGMVVRQLIRWMDGQEFKLTDDGVHFLGKVRRFVR